MSWFRLVCICSAAASALLAQGGFSGQGRYEIVNVKSGRLMGLDTRDRSSVVQFSAPSGDNTSWDIEQAGQGYYYIRNAANGQALEATDNRNSAPVTTAPVQGRPSQQWRLEPGKDGNPLIVTSNGKALDIPDGSNREGLRVQIYDRNGDSNQRFTFRAVQGRGGLGRFGGMRRGGNMGVGAGAAQMVTCSSDDGRRKYCSADTGGGVRMLRQVSGSPCREGESWGWDRNGIWVDRGCRAEFEVGTRAGAVQQRRGGQSYSVTCSSDDGRRNYCPVATSGGVRLTRQISGSPCREGESWGWDRRGIWVDRGCRAEFEVGRR